MDEELNVAKMQRAAKLALSNTAYRQKYERADFLSLNRFQQTLLDGVKRNRFVLGRAGGQIGKSTVAMKYINDCIRIG